MYRMGDKLCPAVEQGHQLKLKKEPEGLVLLTDRNHQMVKSEKWLNLLYRLAIS